MTARVTDQGLVLPGADRAPVPWDEVYHVEWTRRGAWIATSAGMVSTDRETAAAIEQRIAPWEAERDAWVAALPAEQRAAWLGAQPGEVVRYRVVAAAGCVVALAALLALILALAAAGAAASLLRLLPLLMVLITVGLVQTVSRVSADDQGIVVRGLRRRFIAWSDVRDCLSSFPEFGATDTEQSVLLTRHGRWPLRASPAPAAARIREAVQRCVAERREAIPASPPAGEFAAGRQVDAALWCDEHSLAQLTNGGVTRRSLADLDDLTWGVRGPAVSLGGQTLSLWSYLGGETFARALEARLAEGQAPTDDQGELRPEAIEGWLGVSSGGALRCGLSRRTTFGYAAAVLGCLAVLGLTIAGSGHFNGVLFQPLVALVGSLVFAVGSARTVHADAQGLSIQRRGRREYYAWSEITGLKAAQYGWVVQTTRGEVKLSNRATGHDRVVGIIKRLLAARDTGLSLPTDRPTPEVALSRMTGHEPPGERGLSVTRHDDGG